MLLSEVVKVLPGQLISDGEFRCLAFATETEEYLDSGPIIEAPGEGDELPGQVEASSVLLSEIAAIRRSLEIILYFVIPCSVAVLVVYLLCKWFCSTLVERVF